MSPHLKLETSRLSVPVAANCGTVAEGEFTQSAVIPGNSMFAQWDKQLSSDHTVAGLH